MSRVDRHGSKNRSYVMSPRAWTPLTNANLATVPLNVHLVSNRDQHWNPSMALFLEKTNQPLNSKLTAWSPSIGDEPATHPHRDRQTFQVGIYPSCLEHLNHRPGNPHTRHPTRRPAPPWRWGGSEPVTVETPDDRVHRPGGAGFTEC